MTKRLLLALAVLVGTAADLAAPWPLKVVIDNVVRGRPLRGVLASPLTAVAGDERGRLLIAAVVALMAPRYIYEDWRLRAPFWRMCPTTKAAAAQPARTAMPSPKPPSTSDR